MVELKAKKLLKRKTFRLASQLPPLDLEICKDFAKECLVDGVNAGRLQITALAQSKIRYVEEVFRVCRQYNCRIFASISDYKTIAAQPSLMDFSQLGFLRKDYAYLFERYYYFLEDLPDREMGIVVFDELERSKSHILHGQMYEYFIGTRKGRARSHLIIPEPLFVHSDLTAGIHLADLIAYCLAWGFRPSSLSSPKRDELDSYVELLCSMRYRATRVIPDIQDSISNIWSIAIINS